MSNHSVLNWCVLYIHRAQVLRSKYVKETHLDYRPFPQLTPAAGAHFSSLLLSLFMVISNWERLRTSALLPRAIFSWIQVFHSFLSPCSSFHYQLAASHGGQTLLRLEQIAWLKSHSYSNVPTPFTFP